MHPEPVNPTGDVRVDAAAPAGDARAEAAAAPAEEVRAEAAAAATGDARVDAAIAGLAALDDTELADRPAVLEAVHDRLREILGELGDAGRPAHSGRGGPSGDPRR